MVLLALVLTINSIVAAAPSTNVKVKSSSIQLVFDGKTLVLPEGQYIFTVNNSTYVPLRFVSYALQKSVKWDSKTTTVAVAEPSKSETVALKEYLLNATGQTGAKSAKGGNAIAVSPIAAKFTFDGTTKALAKGQSSYMLNGTIYVPLRFVSESVGKVVLWDPVKGQISATTKASEGTEGDTQTGETTEEGTGGVVGGGGTVSTKPTYESITSSAERQLKTLQSACEADLTAIAFNYLGATTAADKEKYIQQGQTKFAACESKFESIMTDTESKLTANGYSTAILAEYRAEYAQSIGEGKAILDSMAN
nr:copper amine oxidase N-terminal domain-containing protein [Paenibacillus phyllosphaerae]